MTKHSNIMATARLINDADLTEDDFLSSHAIIQARTFIKPTLLGMLPKLSRIEMVAFRIFIRNLTGKGV